MVVHLALSAQSALAEMAKPMSNFAVLPKKVNKINSQTSMGTLYLSSAISTWLRYEHKQVSGAVTSAEMSRPINVIDWL